MNDVSTSCLYLGDDLALRVALKVLAKSWTCMKAILKGVFLEGVEKEGTNRNSVQNSIY